MRIETPRRYIAIAFLGACISLSAVAQSPPAAWRCGNTYTDQPCPGGKTLAAADSPSAAQVRDAEGHTRQMQAEAHRMEHERLRSEQMHARQSGLVHLPRPPTTTAASTPVSAPAKSQKKKGRKEPAFFTAAGPGTGAAKKKTKAAKTDTGS